MEGDLPGEEEGRVSSSGDWKQKEPYWDATKKYQPCPYFRPFFAKKIAEMFSIQKPGAEFVPSWFPAEKATCGAPAPFYSCDKCQSVAQCQDVVSSWTPRHPSQGFRTGETHSSVSSFLLPSMTFIPKEVKIHQGTWESTTLQWGQIFGHRTGALLPMNRD